MPVAVRRDVKPPTKGMDPVNGHPYASASDPPGYRSDNLSLEVRLTVEGRMQTVQECQR